MNPVRPRRAPAPLAVALALVAAAAIGVAGSLWWEARPQKALAAEVAAARAAVTLLPGPASLDEPPAAGPFLWVNANELVIDPSAAVHLPDADPHAPLPALRRFPHLPLGAPRDDAHRAHADALFAALRDAGAPFYALDPQPPLTVAFDQHTPNEHVVAALYAAATNAPSVALAYARPDGSLGVVPIQTTRLDAWIASRHGAEVRLHRTLPRIERASPEALLWAEGTPLADPPAEDTPPPRQLTYAALCAGDDCGSPLQGALAEIGRVSGRRPELLWLVDPAGRWDALGPSLPPLLVHTRAIGFGRLQGPIDFDAAPLREVLAQARADDPNAALLLDHPSLTGTVHVAVLQNRNGLLAGLIGRLPDSVRETRACYLQARLTDPTLADFVDRGPDANPPPPDADPRLLACAALLSGDPNTTYRVTFSPDPW